MDINNELILKWEPKIQKLLQGTFVVGMDRDDIAQELRMAIIKAAQGFDEDRGVIFQPINLSLEKSQTRGSKSDFDGWDTSLVDTLADPINMSEDLEFNDLLESSSLLSVAEKNFIILRLEGLNMEEISKDLQTSAYKIRDNLREKIGSLLEEAKA